MVIFLDDQLLFHHVKIYNPFLEEIYEKEEKHQQSLLPLVNEKEIDKKENNQNVVKQLPTKISTKAIYANCES